MAIALGILTLGNILFGHFEEKTPKWKKIFKAVLFAGLAAFLSAKAAPLWAYVWMAAGGASGLSVHFWWCRKHGIDSWTAEPKEKYYELRGWKK